MEEKAYTTKSAAAPPGGRAAVAGREIRIVAFPKEFQKDYWASFDKRLLTIFFISLFVVNGPLVYMANQPKPPASTVLNANVLKLIGKINKVDPKLLEEIDKPPEKEEAEANATATSNAPIRTSAPTNAAGKASRAAAAKAAAGARAGAAAKAAAGRGVLAVAGAVGGPGGGRYAAVDFSGGSSNLDNLLGQVGGLGDATGGAGDRTVLGSGGGGVGGTAGIGDLTAELGGAGALSVAAGSSGSGLIGVGKASISGGAAGAGASAGEIQAVIDQNASAVNSCYQKELKKSPDLKGKLSVAIKINQAGKVSGVSATQNTVGDAVGQCVMNKIRGWNFPRGKKGVITVNQTFVFTK